MCLPWWKVIGATFVGVVLVGRLKCCGLNGLPVAIALPVAVVFPAVVAALTSAGLPVPVGLPFPAALPTSAGLPVSGALPFPFPAGLATFVCWVTPADLPTPVGLPAPVGFPRGCETCPACAPFFGCAFSFFFPCSWPSATHASARLQIKTKNILIGFSFWVVRPCEVLIYSTFANQFLDA